MLDRFVAILISIFFLMVLFVSPSFSHQESETESVDQEIISEESEMMEEMVEEMKEAAEEALDLDFPEVEGDFPDIEVGDGSEIGCKKTEPPEC